MANTYKNIIITPNRDTIANVVPTIRFSGGDAATNTDINLRVYTTQSGTLSFEGSNGQLFSITNDMTGTIFSVNDVSGIPSLEIDAAGLVKLAEFGGNVAVGRANATYKVDVAGTVNASAILINGQSVLATIAGANTAVGAGANTVGVAAFARANNSLLSSSYTASDVLSKLLTVDGAASGLDADLLDGQHGSFYSTDAKATAAFGQANTALTTGQAAFAAANSKVSSVSGTSGRITSSGGTTPAIDLATAGAGAATYSSGISALTVDAYGRITSVTGSAGYVTSSGVTSVSGTGTVSGLTLTGTVTTTGNLTLGGQINPQFSGDSVAKDDITTRTDSGIYETSTGTVAEGWPTNAGSWHHLIAATHSNDTNYYSMQISATFFEQDWYFRNTNGSGTTGWSKVWHNNNDGAASGLDADLLDGQHGSFYSTDTKATAAFGQANTALTTGQAAFAQANSRVSSVSGTGTVSGISLSGTVTSSGSLTLGGTLSASVIDNMTDEHRLFNNMGDNHATRTAFDATNPSYNFGWRFVQGSTNGPGVNGAGQYYSEYVGLGNDYLATGAGSYGMQIAYPRNVTEPYIAIRYNENNTLGAWQKISAGNSDKLNGQASTFYSTDAKATAAFATANAALPSSSYTASDVLSKLLTVDGSGSGLDADLLDGLSSASFMRTDAASTHTTGKLTVYTPAGAVGTVSGTDNLEVFQPTAGTDAFLTFHISGDYAANFGIDGTTNDLFYGGWSAGANKFKVWHAGNDGAASGLDADLLDGQHGSFYSTDTKATAAFDKANTALTTGKAITMAMIFG